jgi:hypothetical protein
MPETDPLPAASARRRVAPPSTAFIACSPILPSHQALLQTRRKRPPPTRDEMHRVTCPPSQNYVMHLFMSSDAHAAPRRHDADSTAPRSRADRKLAWLSIALRSAVVTAAALAAATAAAGPAGPAPVQAAAAIGRAVLGSNTLERRYLVTDSAALLRYALPVDESTDPPVRKVQALLERLGIDLKSKGPVSVQFLKRDLSALDRVMRAEQIDMLLQVPAKRRAEASQILSDVNRTILMMESELGVDSNDQPGGDSIAASFASVAYAVRDIVTSKPTSAPAFDGTSGCFVHLRWPSPTRIVHARVERLS